VKTNLLCPYVLTVSVKDGRHGCPISSEITEIIEQRNVTSYDVVFFFLTELYFVVIFLILLCCCTSLFFTDYLIYVALFSSLVVLVSIISYDCQIISWTW